ncbi:hypothetical protein BH24DEI2_BH24DEI2_21720 [soil metagenome]
MPKTIQIRNVPDDLHKKLKVKVAELGVTLSNYLLEVAERGLEQPTLQETLEQPTLQETLERLAKLSPFHLDEDPVEMGRRHRDA